MKYSTRSRKRQRKHSRKNTSNSAAKDNDTGRTPKGFFDLPREVRDIIYDYYYGFIEPTIKYSRGEEDLNLNFPETALHRVCRTLASEAKAVYMSKNTNLIIDSSECPGNTPEFLGMVDDFCDLKSRLTTLTIKTFGKKYEDVPWISLFRCCPNVYNVNLILEYATQGPRWGDTYAEQAIMIAMNHDWWEAGHYFKIYAEYLENLAWLLEEQFGEDEYRVTGTVHETTNTCSSGNEYLYHCVSRTTLSPSAHEIP